jgi:hypothetical protein
MRNLLVAYLYLHQDIEDYDWPSANSLVPNPVHERIPLLAEDIYDGRNMWK